MARWIEKEFNKGGVFFICEWLNILEKQKRILDVCAISLTTGEDDTLMLVRLDENEEDEEASYAFEVPVYGNIN